MHDDDLPLGAHLVTPRRAFLHHGIYVGGGRVVHYRGLFRRVEDAPIERFARGRKVWVKPHPAPRFSGEACVARARSRLGERRYRLWTNNCEHFSEWCISGTPRSRQVERLLEGLRSMVRRLQLQPRTAGAEIAR